MHLSSILFLAVLWQYGYRNNNVLIIYKYWGNSWQSVSITIHTITEHVKVYPTQH